MRSLPSVESFLIFVLAITLNFLQPSLGRSQDDLTMEPYQVFVAEEEAFAHCGPSEEYYRTDPLRYGQTLEVYAETDNGWLGIRPPADSFCWIPADTVELDDGGELGTIIEDRTVAWIGTQLGRARKYRWQVQLAKGEPVTVIGRSEREGPDGPQLWYRIVPPSGEYRWIHRDSVVMSSEELVQSVRNQVSQVGASEPTGRAEPQSVSSTVEQRGRAQTDHAVASSQDLPVDRSHPEAASETQGDNETDDFVSSGASILDRGEMDRSEAVGSGLKEAWRDQPRASHDRSASNSSLEAPTTAMDAFRQGGLLASLEFLTRPRIQEIGAQPQTVPPQGAPGGTDIANDSNWVAGASRVGQVQPALATASVSAGTSPLDTTQSVSGQLQQVSAESSSPNLSPVSQAVHNFNVVPMERLAQIEAEVRQADLDRLNLILSRLMAAQSSAMETEVVQRAAMTLADSATDSVTAGRARMLAETAERYRRIATRRDGQNVLQTHATLPSGTNSGGWAIGSGGNRSAVVPAASLSPVPHRPAENQSVLTGSSLQNPATPGIRSGHPVSSSGGVASAATNVMKQSGYLVQVYSARSNSPPFALTDNAGRTVAYVTPVPGVNLRTHLNSHINVVGTRGYLTGLNTPHIMVTQAVRTPEQ